MSEPNVSLFSILKLITWLIATILAVVVVLIVCGGAAGWLLHRLWPAIEIGTSVLVGVVATGISLQIFGKGLGGFAASFAGNSSDTPFEEDDDDDDVPPIYITNLPPEAARRYTPPRGRPKRRRQ